MSYRMIRIKMEYWISLGRHRGYPTSHQPTVYTWNKWFDRGLYETRPLSKDENVTPFCDLRRGICVLRFAFGRVMGRINAYNSVEMWTWRRRRRLLRGAMKCAWRRPPLSLKNLSPFGLDLWAVTSWCQDCLCGGPGLEILGY